jgi:putative MFS transporter
MTADNIAPRVAGHDVHASQRDIGVLAMNDANGLLARLERVPFSWWHMRARIVMGSATFLDAFDALSLAFVLPILVTLWNISPGEVGILIGASYIGQLVGALLFSRLAERFGRVYIAAAATLLMSVMSLGCALSGNFVALFTCRLVQGIGVGGEMPVAAAYISELSKAQGRGRFFLLYEMIFPVGLMMTGQIAALIVPMFGWKIMFLIAGVPGLIIVLLLLRLPESPRWLIAHGRIAEAEAIIRDVEARTGTTPLPLDSKLGPLPVSPREGEAAVPPIAPQRTRWLELVSPTYVWRSVVVWALWTAAYFVANGLNNWMPTLYKTVYDLDLQSSLRAASMTNVAQVILLLICAFVIDHFGRRNWTVASFVIGGSLLAYLGFFGANSVISVMILGSLAYGIVGSINAVLYLYTPEIYPTRIRAIGTGLATSWLRLASAVAPALVGLLVSAEGIGSVFLMFAAVSLIGALVALLMIETRGRQLEQIAA